MNRRRLVVGAVASIGSIVPRLSMAQVDLPRGAVVIGVDKCGDLPLLSAASDGARAIGNWLVQQGFEVKLLTDDGGHKEVVVADVFDAVRDFVERGTLEQLIVYFSGHGFLMGTAEHWMLSQAPANPNEAASLTESVEFARYSGIPNVVFISDACRSRPDSVRMDRVRPSIIFPNEQLGQAPADVDRFLATLAGRPAYELPVESSSRNFHGIFTTAFLNAFHSPDQSMVVSLPDGTKVVPNRRLRKYLVREVERLARERSIAISQNPQCEVVSEDSVYIGTLPADANIVAPPTSSGATIMDIVNTEFAKSDLSLTTNAKILSEEELGRTLVTTGFGVVRSKIAESFQATDRRLNTLLVATGFTISGATAREVVTHPDFKASIEFGKEWTSIDVDLGVARGCSVAIRFSDGTGTVLAAIRGFVGNVATTQAGVSNVSYDPGRDNPLAFEYDSRRQHLEALRANVATAAKYGAFRFDGNREERNDQARRMADQIRVLKGYDPTLGIYAAYAYSDAGLNDKVSSVREYMAGDLGVDIFDVAMLSRALSEGGGEFQSRVVPFCPMLTQGWSLLRAKGTTVTDLLQEARDHLLPALWTTFDQTGMDTVIEALKNGRVR